MKRFVFLICGFCLFSFSSLFAEKANKGGGKKCPPWFPVSIENDVLCFNPLSASASIQILDERGEVVYEEYVNIDQPQLYTIPIDYLPSGNYTLLVVSEQMNYQLKFIL